MLNERLDMSYIMLSPTDEYVAIIAYKCNCCGRESDFARVKRPSGIVSSEDVDDLFEHAIPAFFINLIVSPIKLNLILTDSIL